MRRIERLINLIAALLDARRPMTADEIRARIAGYDQATYEAFRRAFERDKDALRAMGIPLEVVTTDPFADQADGYIIPKGRYYLPDLGLEPDELAALRLASDALLGAHEEAGAGLLKLSIDAPSIPVAGPSILWGADLAAEQPYLGPVYSALLARRPIRFDYEPASKTKETRTVRPYGLVHRRGNWYVVGWDESRAAVRSFKLSRFVSRIEVLEGSYDIPDGFDASAQVAESWEIGAQTPITATVRFDASMRWWAEHNMPDSAAREAPAGALDVDMPASNLDALVSWIIGFGTSVEILSPPEARARLFDRLGPFLEGARSDEAVAAASQGHETSA
jgi:predicted DNA-binding transcriptional regulator YafY